MIRKPTEFIGRARLTTWTRLRDEGRAGSGVKLRLVRRRRLFSWVDQIPSYGRDFLYLEVFSRSYDTTISYPPLEFQIFLVVPARADAPHRGGQKF